MLRKETIESYRRMPLAEKLRLVMRMTDEQTDALLHGPSDIVRRRFELLRRRNDERNRGMGECLRRTRRT